MNRRNFCKGAACLPLVAVVGIGAGHAIVTPNVKLQWPSLYGTDLKLYPWQRDALRMIESSDYKSIRVVHHNRWRA